MMAETLDALELTICICAWLALLFTVLGVAAWLTDWFSGDE